MPNAIDKILNWYFTKNSLPYWCIFLIDCAIIMFSGFLTYWIFNNLASLTLNLFQVGSTLFCYVLLSIPGFRLFHTYSGFMRYSSFVDLMRVVYGNAVSLVLVLLADYGMELLPRDLFAHFNTTSIFLLYIFATLLMWALRVFVKTLYDVAFSNTRAVRILIYGAMQGGVGLAKNIKAQRPRKFVVKGFITHFKKTRHQEILGEKVYSVAEDLAEVIQKNDIEAVLVSPYRVKEFRENQEVQDKIIGAGAKILMAQNVKEMDEGDELGTEYYGNMQLREVSVEELLPRQEIEVNMVRIGNLLRDRIVVVTGAAGSIGSEMVRQIANYNPAKLILIDQAETPMHDLMLEFRKTWPYIDSLFIVSSITNKERMVSVFRTYKPDYVFHAAAYKHVPMMEDIPGVSIQNNVVGTRILADLAVENQVKKFVMISTDKAVNPTNVMGCSKRLCEIYVQSLNTYLQKNAKGDRTTQFVTTRFGNVLGSNGSVIPLFKKQIEAGGPVTVTHPDIIRYFMLIPEACALVLEAGTMGNGGEVFVFDMGKPVKIAELAKKLIRNSGRRDVKIQYTGLREGEKLYEEVLFKGEEELPTTHPKIRVAKVRQYEYEDVCKQFDELEALAKTGDDIDVVRKMKMIVPEFKSNNSQYEVIDRELKHLRAKQ